MRAPCPSDPLVPQELVTLKLKSNANRRLRVGHLWVFSNEIDTDKTPLQSLTAGQLVNIADARGKLMGTAYAHPNSLICARLLARRADVVPDAKWFETHIAQALTLRESVYPGPFYRLIHGESDGLPGLVVDRFGDVLVVQIATAGMENLKDIAIQALQNLLQPKGILLRNDGAAREMESLPKYIEAVGEVGADVALIESGVQFAAPLREGQKTGWFYDQRDNRDRLARYVSGKQLLDVFSYAGAWAVRALAAGASSASCVDSSESALDAAEKNARLNGFELESLRGSALDVLRQLRSEGRSFEVIVVDPPALIKRKKDHEKGLEHYAALNRAAMQLLKPGGVLISCSCSFHLEPESLQRVLLREARRQNRQLQILEQGGQGPDHPVHPAIPETRYLKAFYCRLS